MVRPCPLNPDQTKGYFLTQFARFASRVPADTFWIPQNKPDTFPRFAPRVPADTFWIPQNKPDTFPAKINLTPFPQFGRYLAVFSGTISALRHGLFRPQAALRISAAKPEFVTRTGQFVPTAAFVFTKIIIVGEV